MPSEDYTELRCWFVYVYALYTLGITYCTLFLKTTLASVKICW